VALFIDWDNLAISIAADLSGATPDVRRIVEKAQEYGTLVTAKAYAEWNTLSERLSVYKNGVEPVYAPTFRFESESTAQAARGKSLADPVMVADCVETLHLLPHVGVFVLVSGDKDLLPVVRLARLRGKRVVIIGPDYAANVLREMADDFIPYRSLVEAAGPAAAPTPAQPAGRRGGPPVGRRRPAAPAPRPEPTRAEVAPARPIEVPVERLEPVRPEPPAPRPAEPAAPEPVAARPQRGPVQLPVRERPARTVPWPETAPIETPRPVASPIAPPAAPPERRPAEAEAPRESLAQVHAAMVDALRQLAGQGKTRVRATNLKDQLLARIPGFSERRYGFSKFKDFLMAAEQAGLIKIEMIGPVHWVSLPAYAEAGESPEGEIVPAAGRQAEVVRFIAELCQRSRWLTYTYVLNNVSNLLAQTMPAAEAEAEARTILNQLVNQGALQIDREPRPVEVGGVTHRVRMCHINEEHPLFRALLRAPEESPAATESGVAEGPAAAATAEVPAAEATVAPAAGATEPARRRRSRSRRRRGGREGAAAEAVSGEEPATAADGESAGAAVAPTGEPAAPGEAAPETLEVRPPTAVPAEGAIPMPAAEAPAAAEEVAQREVAAAPVDALEAPSAGEPDGEMLPLERVFENVTALVRAGVSARQPELRASTLKQRLSRRLGGFDEGRYGFGRFRDFLGAMADAGLVRVRDEGRQTWVSPPEAEGTPGAPAES
jgi:uncharacterized LabA/DUF88 family protein